MVSHRTSMGDDLTEYERQRAERIANNAAVLQQLQVSQLAAELSHAVETAANGPQKTRKQLSNKEQPVSLRPRSARASAARAASRLTRQHDSEAGSSGGSASEESEGDQGDRATSDSAEDSGREGRSRRNPSGQQDSGAAIDEYEPDSATSSGHEDSTSGSEGPSEAEGADTGPGLAATVGGSTKGRGSIGSRQRAQARQPQQKQQQQRRHRAPGLSQGSKRDAAAAAQPAGDGAAAGGVAAREDGLVGDDEDWELQQALALSLAEVQGAPGAPQQQGERQQRQQQQQHQEQVAGQPEGLKHQQQFGDEARGQGGTHAGASKAPAATAPAAGAPATAVLSLENAPGREPGSAPPFQARPGFKEDRATAAAVAAALAPVGFASRARWRKRQQQQQQAQQAEQGGGSTALPTAGTSSAMGGSTSHGLQGAAAAAGAAKDEKGKAKRGEARKRPKKLPAFDPSSEEVHSCFALLAAQGGGKVTAAALLTVATTLGIEVDESQVGDMLQLAADRLAAPALGSGGGGGGSSLTVQHFQQLVELFRVKE